jgi:hypothetical protein
MLFEPHPHNLSIVMVRPISVHGFNRTSCVGERAGGSSEAQGADARPSLTRFRSRSSHAVNENLHERMGSAIRLERLWSHGDGGMVWR